MGARATKDGSSQPAWCCRAPCSKAVCPLAMYAWGNRTGQRVLHRFSCGLRRKWGKHAEHSNTRVAGSRPGASACTWGSPKRGLDFAMSICSYGLAWVHCDQEGMIDLVDEAALTYHCDDRRARVPGAWVHAEDLFQSDAFDLVSSKSGFMQSSNACLVTVRDVRCCKGRQVGRDTDGGHGTDPRMRRTRMMRFAQPWRAVRSSCALLVAVTAGSSNNLACR